MNPTNVAPVAPQDLRSAVRPRARRTGIAGLVGRVLNAWMTGWTWYAQQGFAPAAVEPAFPFRERGRARRALPVPVARWVIPGAPVPVARLYDCAAGAGCA